MPPLGLLFGHLFVCSTLEMLAHRTGQAIIIWRNTPACCVAETYNLLSLSWRAVVHRKY